MYIINKEPEVRSDLKKINKKIDPERVPKHIAFIMDGNGRWAKVRGLARKFGHKEGYRRMVKMVKHCADLGVSVVSYFAFSTENWNRPKDEVDEIFRIIRENMHADSEEFIKHGIRISVMGDITAFPGDLQDKLNEMVETTKGNTRCTLNLCANYGGRADITQAVNKAIKSGKQNISEQEFSKYLYGSDLPAPDFIVRTSGEMRISNFMLWQMAYSELYFIKTFWPDMNERLIEKCIIEYQQRDRRYGKV